MADELGQSYGHLRLAVGHAAEGMTTTLGATRSTTRKAVSPLYDQIREGGFRRGIRMTKKKNRWRLAGLLAAGATVGAVGAMFARRRRTASQWNQYEPGIPDVGFADSGSESGRIGSTTKKVAAGAAAVAETVSVQAGRLAETLHERTSPGADPGPSGTSATGAGASGDPTPGETDETARPLAGRTSGRPYSSFATSDETGGNNTRP